ncbi:MAG: thioredoxin [Anaerolineae bacterium]|nr:thioredoxin [Anaerolineae bacterium]
MHVTSETFRQQVLKSKKPVLVDFWAPWCGPCHQIAPYIDKIALEHGSKVKVVKLDIDANQVIARRYGVQSIPTMIMFEGGQPANKITGANPVALRKMVERFTD